MSQIPEPSAFKAPPTDQTDRGVAGEGETQPIIRRGSRAWLDRLGHVGVIYALALLLIPASRLIDASLPSVSQIQNVLIIGLFLAVVSFGQGLAILTGGFDLSVPGTITAAAFVTAAVVTGGGSVVVAVVLAILVAAGIGAMNGVGIGLLRVPPFIMTLAVGAITTNALLGINQGEPSRPSPGVLTDLFLGQKRLAGIPIPIWFLAAVVLIGWLIQSRTSWGRRVYAVGNGELPARIAGLRVPLVLIGVYAVAGASYGLAGVMLLGYSQGAILTMGDPYLLPSIAAVLVGGSAIKGGAGSFLGTVGGVLLLTLVSIDISALGLAEGWKQVMYGGIVLSVLLVGKLASTPSS